MRHIKEKTEDMNLPSLTEHERRHLDKVIADISKGRDAVAIFYIANGLYDIGMQMVVEEEL